MQDDARSRFENPNAPCALSRVTATLKFAKISLIVVPIEIDPGCGLAARLTIPAPPVAVSATKLAIAAPPPNLSARYIMNMKPAP